ncbi:MAG TPA: DinB family protein [Thermoanaerobaculia bacterium]|nr:DinB family protein [Thermoanaerobaculia bacterium]HQR67029.1 DinB family protein [Thermoanaerobaculia bacterium]
MTVELLALYDYNEWANERVIRMLRRLPAADYVREMGGGWPSVRATFVHLAGATDAWAERFAGKDVLELPKESALPELEDAVALLLAAHGKHRARLKTLTREALESPFSWRNLAGEVKTAPLEIVVRHVVNHQTYHRGQISSMVRRLGHAPVATDMVRWGIEVHGAETGPR